MNFNDPNFLIMFFGIIGLVIIVFALLCIHNSINRGFDTINETLKDIARNTTNTSLNTAETKKLVDDVDTKLLIIKNRLFDETGIMNKIIDNQNGLADDMRMLLSFTGTIANNSEEKIKIVEVEKD